jgi:hypothetical protein
MEEGAMQVAEFKAWFMGYTEDMQGPPNKAQWAKIQQRVSEITPNYVPPPVYWLDGLPRRLAPYWGTTTAAPNTTADFYTTHTFEPTEAVTSIGITDWVEVGKAEYRAGGAP